MAGKFVMKARTSGVPRDEGLLTFNHLGYFVGRRGDVAPALGAHWRNEASTTPEGSDGGTDRFGPIASRFSVLRSLSYLLIGLPGPKSVSLHSNAAMLGFH